MRTRGQLARPSPYPKQSSEVSQYGKPVTRLSKLLLRGLRTYLKTLLVLRTVLVEQVCGTRGELQSLADAALALLELEFASLEVLPRRHEVGVVGAFVFSKQSDELCVDEPVVHRDLAFDKFGKRLPDPHTLRDVLCH